MKTRIKPVAIALALCLFAPAALAQPMGLPSLEVDPALIGAPKPPQPKPEEQPVAETAQPPRAGPEPAAPPRGLRVASPAAGLILSATIITPRQGR